MIPLALFISLFLGINIRQNLILGIIEAVILLIFVFFRFHKKMASISLGVVLLGVGLSFIRPSFEKESYQSVVVEVKDNYYIASSSLEKFYIYEKEHTHEVGDILNLKGYKKDLDFIKIESGFDFKEYLYNKGVYKEFVVMDLEIRFSNPIKIASYKKQFLGHLDKDTSSLVGSILFGKSENESTISLFRELHLARLISNSGLFLSFFYFLISSLFKRLFKERIGDIISISLFSLYSVFTFPRFVVIKFIFVLLFRIINKYFLNKRFNYVEILSASAIIFLLVDYHLAYQDSFILSIFIPLIAIFTIHSYRNLKKWKVSLIVVTIISGFFIPFAIKYYQEISILSILFQLLMMPFIYIYYLFSLVTMIGIPIYSLLNGFTIFLNGTLSFFKPVLFKIYMGEITSSGIQIYEIIYFIFLYLITTRMMEILRVLIPTFSIALSIYIVPFKNIITSFVSFINVGQGNSCIIHNGLTTIMIDTGGNINQDIAKECLIPFLKKKQIYDIDLLITTHDDFDHSGAASSLISNFTVKEYVKDYRLFPIKIGNLTLNNYNIYPYLWEEENDESLVISFTLKDYDFLIMGDAPKKVEKQILKDNPNLKTDILLVGHHGSNTSSDENFIKNISPEVAIISCGKNNKYGHPHKSTISILNKYKINIRRTDLEGTITYSFLF